MIALNILDIKKFMSLFLGGTLFDEYSLVEAQITTFCTFSIDGRYEALFEDAPPGETSYVRWSKLKEHCFSIIRGKKTPLFFKFVFFYPEEELPKLLGSLDTSLGISEVKGLCLNLRYDGTNLVLTTGTSLKVFSMDRSADRAWDDYVRRLLMERDILISE